MAVVLACSSSLALLRSIPPQTGVLTRVEEALPVTELSTSGKELRELGLEAYGLQRPYHVLAANGKCGPQAKGVQVHHVSYEEFPAGSLLRLAPNLYVCGPELTYIQMTAQLGFVARVVLGHELCGEYSHFGCMASGFYDRPPITTVEQIESITYELPRARGTKAARRALRYVRNLSRSPMETVVNCMLFLPSSEGGYGFALPTLNYVETLDSAARAITGTKTCKIDTCWPDSKVGIEYDGKEAHTDPEKDRRRREALASLGWTIHVLVLDDVKSAHALDRMVDLFASRIPRATSGSESTVAARAQLLKSLFTFTRLGLGLNAAFFGVPVRRGSVKLHLT